MSNLSYIISKIRIVAIFIIVDLQTIFLTECVGMFMICSHATLHVPNSSCLLVVVIMAKANCRFHVATMLLFYITQNKNSFNVSWTYYHTSFKGPVLSGTFPWG